MTLKHIWTKHHSIYKDRQKRQTIFNETLPYKFLHINS